MRKIVFFIVVLILTSCTTQQAKDILTKLFFDSKELVDEIGPIDDNETEYVDCDTQNDVEEQENYQYEQPQDDKDTKNQFVDLGLSVKWASCNVGANSPEEYGAYYTFSEAQKLGGKGERLSSKKEFRELTDNCDWTWTIQNGKNGYNVTSRRNGNSIFLPASGYLRSSNGFFGVGSEGHYWSSLALYGYTTVADDPDPYYDSIYVVSSDSFVNDHLGLYLYFDNCFWRTYDGDRNDELSVRLVQDVE